MNKSILVASLIASAVAASACTDADRAQISAYGNKFHVTLYGASGIVVKEWDSNGKVSTEDRSDGWYFMDAATGKLVRVSGTVVVEQAD